MKEKDVAALNQLLSGLPTFDRTARLEKQLSDMSDVELRLTALQAIDAAHRAAAEVAESKAIVEGAIGESIRLAAENRELQAELSDIRRGVRAINQGWRRVRRRAHPLDSVEGPNA